MAWTNSASGQGVLMTMSDAEEIEAEGFESEKLSGI